MSLTEDEMVLVEHILTKCEESHEKMNDWERKFTADQRERFEKYGADMHLSPKQWAVLRKIEDRLDG